MLKGVWRREWCLAICVIIVFAVLIFAINLFVFGYNDITYAANSASIDASVTIKPSLTLNIPTNTITMNLDPANHDFDEKDLTVSVGTNNPSGYQLTVNTIGDSNTLVNTADSAKTISNLSSSYSVVDFPANYWGYRLSNGSASSGDYGQFTSPSLVSESDGPVNNVTKTLGFGAKVDYTKPSGLYELNLNFTAVANPIITYMQDLTPALCTSTPTTAVDKRDEKTYTIARLSDGQCWMVSDLNLAGGTVITAADSDLPTGSSYTLPTSSATGFSSDTGRYVYNTGNETTDQVNCTSSKPCNSYYSWLAATAGGGGVNGNGYNAPYSICPKGWRLPTATTSDAPPQTNPNWKTGDYYKLATAYGANLESNYYENTGTFYNNAGSGTIPNFLLAGNYGNSKYELGGDFGLYWSSTSQSSAWSYFLVISPSNVDLANNGRSRRYGLPIRCILNES